jgi:hypothetical protein
MKRIAGLLSLIAALALMLASATAVPAQDATPEEPSVSGINAADLYGAVLEDQRSSVVGETEGALSIYTIDATIDPGGILPGGADAGTEAAPEASPAPAGAEEAAPEMPRPATITGTLDLQFINDTGSELSELYLRLYANDERYTDGGIELGSVTLNGESVDPTLSVSDTVAELALTEPLGDTEPVDVSIEFTTTVIQSFDFLASSLNLVPETGTLSLAHWYPIVAGYDAESGWVLDPVSLHGDLVFSSTALYDATLTAPEEVTVVTSGSMIEESASNGSAERRFVTGPAREFTVMVDDDFQSISEEVDGTTVTVWFNMGREAGAEAILSYGVQSLTLFNGLFGTYPFSDLDIVESQMGGPGGIEFSQLIGIDTVLFESPEMMGQMGLPVGLAEYITAHEVAHQWWYGLVGNNHYAHAFLDEAMAETSTIIYFEEQYDAATAQQQLVANVSSFYAFQYGAAGDFTVNTPTNDFPDGFTYSGTVYAKGALGLLAIREAIGEEAFVEGLNAYVAHLRFGIATPDDLRMALEAASGQNLEALWTSWFETAGERVVITVELDAAPSASPMP